MPSGGKSLYHDMPPVHSGTTGVTRGGGGAGSLFHDMPPRPGYGTPAGGSSTRQNVGMLGPPPPSGGGGPRPFVGLATGHTTQILPVDPRLHMIHGGAGGAPPVGHLAGGAHANPPSPFTPGRLG